MKIHIYAILPDTEEGQMDSVSSAIKCDSQDVSELVAYVTALFPDWKELSIERITSQD